MSDLTAAVDRLIGVSLAAGSALGRQAGPDQQLTRDFEDARADILARLAASEARTERLEAVRHAQQDLINALAGGMNASIVTERYERVWDACCALQVLDDAAALDGPATTVEGDKP